MTHEDNLLLNTLRIRLNDLINELNNTRAEFEAFKETSKRILNEKDIEIYNLKEEVKDLEVKYKNLKTARSLVFQEGDSTTTKKQLNELVREIDKCIALLNT